MKLNFKIGVAASILTLLVACNESGDKVTAEQWDLMNQKLDLLTKEVLELRKDVAAVGTVEAQAKQAVSIPLKNKLTVMGDTSAEFAIVEYMDYQCPYCLRHAKNVLPSLKRKYIDTGLIQYIVEDFPLEFHGQAKNAAIFARCAAQQGKFMQAHELLITNAKKLNQALFDDMQQQLNFDQSAYSACFNSSENRKALDDEFIAATKLGVSGTPRFFIGRIEEDTLVDVVSLSGARAIDAFDAALAQVFGRGG